MPSPIWTTEPTSRVSIADEKFLICSTRMELISSVGAAMVGFLRPLARGVCEGSPQAFESPADAVVDEPVANPRHDAADDRRVDARGDRDFLGIAIQIGGKSLRDESLHVGIQ